jgi:hypothetical protein
MKNYKMFVESNSGIKVYRGIGSKINTTYGGVSDDGLGVFWTDNIIMAKWFAGMIEYDSDKEEYVSIENSNGKIIESTIKFNHLYIINYYDEEENIDSFQIYMNEIKDNGGVENYKKKLLNEGYDGIELLGNTTNYYNIGTYNIYIELK